MIGWELAVPAGLLASGAVCAAFALGGRLDDKRTRREMKRAAPRLHRMLGKSYGRHRR